MALCGCDEVTIHVDLAGNGRGTITSDPAGLTCSQQTCSMAVETPPTLLFAQPAADSFFAGWQGACQGDGECRIATTEDVRITARFDANALRVVRTGGGSVRSEPPGIDCGEACAMSAAVGQSIILDAFAEPGFAFTGWGGPCMLEPPPRCRVTIANTPTIIEATFAPFPSHTLMVTKTGAGSGTVVSSPGVDCGVDCSEQYADGATPLLRAIPDATSVFAGWSGPCSVVPMGCHVSMTTDVSIQAAFEPAP